MDSEIKGQPLGLLPPSPAEPGECLAIRGGGQKGKGAVCARKPGLFPHARELKYTMLLMFSPVKFTVCVIHAIFATLICAFASLAHMGILAPLSQGGNNQLCRF